MAASIKLSELQPVIVADLTSDDLLLVTDVASSTSRKASFGDLKLATRVDELGDFEENQAQQLQAGLSYGYLFVQNMTVGG